MNDTDRLAATPAPPASLRDDSMELAHIVHGASDLGWSLSMELAERLWTAGVTLDPLAAPLEDKYPVEHRDWCDREDRETGCACLDEIR